MIWPTPDNRAWLEEQKAVAMARQQEMIEEAEIDRELRDIHRDILSIKRMMEMLLNPDNNESGGGGEEPRPYDVDEEDLKTIMM